jgi:flagellar hook assembly protein FlgD
VWDVQNNSSAAHTEFVVAQSAEMALKHVLNYPNPFTTRTKFYVEHNQCCVQLEMQVQIYTISGKIVKTINTAVQNEGYRIDGVDWDGKDDYGDKIGAGVYIYRIKLKSSDGKSAEKIEKLVILN